MGDHECEVYQARRGDVVLFSKRSWHRTLPIRRGRRRALVGRFVPAEAALAPSRQLPTLVYTNGFHGSYLCEHGLSVGEQLKRSHCFSQLGDVSTPRRRLASPIRMLLGRALEMTSLHGASLSQAMALALTLSIELTVVATWCALRSETKKCERMLACSCVASLFTHPIVWFWADVLFCEFGPALRVLVIEALIVPVEALCFVILGQSTPLSSLILSAMMNSTSFLFGVYMSHAFGVYSEGFCRLSSCISWALGVYLSRQLLGSDAACTG